MLTCSGQLFVLLVLLGFEGPPDPGTDPWADPGLALEGELVERLGVRMVEIDGATWRRLQPPPPEPELAPAPWAAARELRVRPAEGGLRVDVRWTVRGLDGAWFDEPLARLTEATRLLELRVDGRPVSPAVERGSDGHEALRLALRVKGSARVELSYFVAHDLQRGPLPLPLLEAVRGTAVVTGEGLAFVDEAGAQLPVVDGAVWSPGALAVARRSDERPEADAGRLALATVGVGITVGEAETRVRARVRLSLRRGELERLRLRATGAGRDLQVSGPNVRNWTRDDDRVEVELASSVRDRVELELSWSAPTPQGTTAAMELPRFEVSEAYRVEGSVQIARDGEVEVLPGLAGWVPRASSQLPDWGEGLVMGSPTAAFVGPPDRGGTLDLLRFEAVQGPPVLVDVADYTLALSKEGRMIGQVRYEVRNDRGATLRIEPPAGVRLISVRVAGEVVAPGRDVAQDGHEAWLVPLRRSVESVEGLISFPVEVALLGEPSFEAGGDFEGARRVEDALSLPVLDAPVAAQRVTLHLPPRFRSRLEPGERGVVETFSEGEGIAYGFSAGDGRGELADGLFQSAVRDWLDNDFWAAKEKLAELEAIGADNSNVGRLRSNIDLVLGDSDERDDGGGQRDEVTGVSAGASETENTYILDGQNISVEHEPMDPVETKKKVRRAKAAPKADAQQAVVARRVRQQARARSGQQRVALKAKAEQAQQLRVEGRYREAERAYGEALALGDELAALEDEESMEQAVDNRRLAEELEAIRREEAQRRQIEGLAAVAPAQGPQDANEATAASATTATTRERERPSPAPVPESSRRYDFDDDDIDGELLTPEGAAASASRSRASFGSTIDKDLGGLGPGIGDIAEREAVEDADASAAGGEVGGVVGGVVGGEVGGVVGSCAGAAADVGGETVGLDGDDVPNELKRPRPPPNEPLTVESYPVDVDRVSVSSGAARSPTRLGRRAGGGRSAGRAKSSARKRSFKAEPEPAASPEEGSAAASPAPPMDPNAALEGPTVTASGLAVVVPTIGEAVRYQQLLIPAGGQPVLVIDARRERRRGR